MKRMLFVIMFLIMPLIVNAGPFLICDPNPTAETYLIEGSITASNIIAEGDGSIKYDLAGIAEGLFNIQVSACNLWGCSTPVPFSFTKALPQSSTGMRLNPE